jgi:hypothetical protein
MCKLRPENGIFFDLTMEAKEMEGTTETSETFRV